MPAELLVDLREAGYGGGVSLGEMMTELENHATFVNLYKFERDYPGRQYACTCLLGHQRVTGYGKSDVDAIANLLIQILPK